MAHSPSRTADLPCCAKDPNTSWHAGDSDPACDARHSTMRPPPGGTLAHSERTSAPHADLSTNNTSRGRIGRSIIGAAAGAAPAAAVAAPAGAALPSAAGAALPPLHA